VKQVSQTIANFYFAPVGVPAPVGVALPPTGELIRYRTNYFESIVVPTILELHKH